MSTRLQDLLDVRSPFFLPLGRRVVVTGGVILWALFELSSASYVWAILFGAVGVYLVYQFFIRFDPEEYQDRSDDS